MAESINIPYADWKQLVNDNSWTVYHKVVPDPETRLIYSGTHEKIIKSLAKNISADKSEDGNPVTDYTDWNTNFSGSSTEVHNDEELLLKILQAAFPDLEAERDPVTGALTVNISGEQIKGKEIRYEQQGNVDLPAVGSSHATVYEIAEVSVFYKFCFQVNSDNIYIQVEIDSQNIFPSGNGFKLEDLESLGLGSTGGGYYGGGGVRGEMFGFYQYDSNKWIWEPPRPLRVESNMKIKMKASTSSTSKDCLKSIAIRRTLA